MKSERKTRWRRGESEYSDLLKTRKLLILRDAKNAENGKIASNWNVSGTRLFRWPISIFESGLPSVSSKLGEFGEWVGRSQVGAEQHLGNQISETAELVRSARALGSVAASAFGAGFGGSVWAMVQSNTAPDFLNRWKEYYHKRFPAHAETSEFFVSGAGSPAVLF